MIEFEKSENIMEDLKLYSIKEKLLNPKVSIIVPVYNSELYISKCLMSLVRQTLKDIEIIVVNDGSTDNSQKYIDMFTKEDMRIKFIVQENKKQGAARNVGTNIATGEYIGFVDSDDWVDLNYFEKLYNAAKKYDSDISLATNVRIGNGKTKKRLNIKEEKVYTELQDKFDICNHFNNECPTNKIYKLEMLKNNSITWPEKVFCEDKLFTTQAVYYANSIVSVPETYYYYYRNPKSTVNNKELNHSIKKQTDKNNAKLAVLNFLRNKNATLRDKEFWAITKLHRFLGIPIFVEKESLHSRVKMLFSIIKIGEKTL